MDREDLTDSQLDALAAFANGRQISPATLRILELKGAVTQIPAVTTKGREALEAAHRVPASWAGE